MASSHASLMGGSDAEDDLVFPLDPQPMPAPAPAPAPIETYAPSAKPNFASAGPPIRDRIVILGRRRAGKTIFLARLYEALWQGCKMIDGRVVAKGEPVAGRNAVEMSCRSLSGSAHAHFMQIVEELRAGKWPSATVGNSYADIVVSNGGRDHVVTALDYPGEVFRKAFMLDSEESDALELRAAVDRAAAAILLIDPAVVSAGGAEAQEDIFGLTQAAMRIRKSEGGDMIPIAIVFTKCDMNAAFLKEAGGVRKFAEKHFAPLFRGIERTSVFPCAAVRVVQNSLGKQVPRADKPPENVVEPLRYCLDFLERSVDIKRVKVAREQRAEAVRAAEASEVAARKRSALAWVLFAVAVTMLMASVAAAAFWFTLRK